MLFEKVVSEGLSHNSYLIGQGQEALVIDPRRDCEVYIEKASKAGFAITHILETHRNEDYLIGSVELASRTGARIWHADCQWNYGYGQPVEDKQRWAIGRLSVEAIHCPGHTPGMMNYVVYGDRGFPWIVFSGDTLFAGDVGRTDLLGEEYVEQMTGLLYDSIFDKILPLGDEVIICPAHGAGSVCGSMIADRPWTTVGLERKHNPKLQYADRKEFITNVAKMQERPLYFRMMEKLNLEGAAILGALPAPKPLPPTAFKEHMAECSLLDTRDNLGYNLAHIPGFLSIWAGGISAFAGWFLPYDRPLLLVNEGDDATQVVCHLVRMGYDSFCGYLAGGMLAWHTSGYDSDSNGTVTAQALCELLDSGEDVWILDVRKDAEVQNEGEITGAHHIHITMLPRHLDEVPRDRPVYVFCGTGLRSTIAAGLLRNSGHEDVNVVLGGVEGWRSILCPLRKHGQGA